jgi:hypothetical protein
VTAPVLLLLAVLQSGTPAAAAASAAPPDTPPTFDVGGDVSLTDEGGLAVRVDLTNRGALPAGAVTVGGELAGHYDEAQVPEGVDPGRTASARLEFPREVPRPGVYPVVLLLDYAPRVVAPGAPSALSQRAFLLLTLGAGAAPAVKVSAPEVPLRDRVALPVTLESLDGRPHRVRVRVLTPRGVNAERASDEAQVPARGTAVVSVPLLRGGVPRPSRQGVLLIAETLDGEVAQASAGTTVVAVEPGSDVMPHLRDPFIAAAALFLLAAAVLEWRRLRDLRRSSDPAA